MLSLQKTLCTIEESGEALWLSSRARQMPHLLIGENSPGEKSSGRKGTSFSTAYEELSRKTRTGNPEKVVKFCR